MLRCRMKSAGIPVCGAMSSANLPSNSGSTSTPSRRTERSQDRWFRPTWPSDTRAGPTSSSEANSRWNPMATLHRPTARCPAVSRARVTMPTGLVKSMMNAEGEARRLARSARSSTTGTVRSALASPPAPVVSCPTQPQASGLAADPELEQDRVRALGALVQALGPAHLGGVVVGGHDPGRDRPDHAQPARVGVDQHQLLDLGQQPPDPVSELGRVGGSAADHRKLHENAFTSSGLFWATWQAASWPG